MKHHQLGSALF